MIQKFQEKKYLLSYILLAAFLFAMFCMKKAVSVAVSLWPSLAVGIILLQKFQILAPDTLFPWEEYGVNMLARGVDVARAISGTVLLLLIFCELFWLFGNSLSFWTASMFLAAGFDSAAVLGFSPTIYASGNRVFSIYLYATIILICYIVNQCFDHKCGKKEWAALLVTGIFSLASTAKNIWLVAGF